MPRVVPTFGEMLVTVTPVNGGDGDGDGVSAEGVVGPAGTFVLHPTPRATAPHRLTTIMRTGTRLGVRPREFMSSRVLMFAARVSGVVQDFRRFFRKGVSSIRSNRRRCAGAARTRRQTHRWRALVARWDIGPGGELGVPLPLPLDALARRYEPRRGANDRCRPQVPSVTCHGVTSRVWRGTLDARPAARESATPRRTRGGVRTQ